MRSATSDGVTSFGMLPRLHRSVLAQIDSAAIRSTKPMHYALIECSAGPRCSWQRSKTPWARLEADEVANAVIASSGQQSAALWKYETIEAEAGGAGLKRSPCR